MRIPHRPGRPSERALGILLIVVSACGFGSGPFFTKSVYAAGMPALGILFWRFLMAALFSWGFVLVRGSQRASLRALPQRRILVLVLLGLMYVGNSGTYVASLKTVPVSLSAIITYIYPAMVAVLSIRYARRLEGRRAWFALALSIFGVALAVGGIEPGTAPPLSGLLLAIASPTIYAVWIILSARLVGDRPAPELGEEVPVLPAGGGHDGRDQVPDPAPAGAVMTSATAFAAAVLVLVSGGTIAPADVPTAAWPGLAGFALATAIAFQSFYAGVRRVGAARAALISTVEPVYTITLATILFGETLTTMQLVGAMLVIAGVMIAESGQTRGSAEAGVPSAARPPEPATAAEVR